MECYAANCWPKALKRDGPASLVISMTCIVVAQKLRFLEDLGFKWDCIDPVYRLPIEAVCIFCTIVEHPITDSRSLRYAQRSASMERQRFIVISIQLSPSCIVASIERSIGQLSGENDKSHAHCPVIEMSVNWASMISGLTSWKITGLFNGI
jgi:hypothetical protein